MYINISEKAVSRLMSGGQIVTVSSVSKDGVADVMTAAWNTPFDSNMALVVLDLGHTTTRNILDTGKFVIGIPQKDQIKAINAVGSVHGRDCGDKFEYTKTPKEKSEKLGISVIPDQLAYIECELADKETFEKTGVCIGKAVNVYVQDRLWDTDHDSFAEGFKETLHYVSENKYYVEGRIIDVE